LKGFNCEKSMALGGLARGKNVDSHPNVCRVGKTVEDETGGGMGRWNLGTRGRKKGRCLGVKGKNRKDVPV